MWELNLGPMHELPMLLTAEPYLQPSRSDFKISFFYIYYYIISYCKSLWARGFFPIKFIENFIHVSSIFLFPPPLSSPPHSSQLRLPQEPFPVTVIVKNQILTAGGFEYGVSFRIEWVGKVWAFLCYSDSHTLNWGLAIVLALVGVVWNVL